MSVPLLPSLAIAGSTSFAVWLAQMTSETTIPIGDALPAFIFIGGLVWWLSRKLAEMRVHQESHSKALEDLRADIKALPCRGECPSPGK